MLLAFEFLQLNQLKRSEEKRKEKFFLLWRLPE
jgi:hypothetical protein